LQIQDGKVILLWLKLKWRVRTRTSPASRRGFAFGFEFHKKAGVSRLEKYESKFSFFLQRIFSVFWAEKILPAKLVLQKKMKISSHSRRLFFFRVKFPR